MKVTTGEKDANLQYYSINYNNKGLIEQAQVRNWQKMFLKKKCASLLQENWW
jgi:hypothetical protein